MPKLESQRVSLWSAAFGMGLLVLVLAGAAGMPEAPAVSTFAPAEDLVKEADKYITGLEESVASVESGTDKFDDVKENIEKEANTLAIIALNLGKHDQDNKFKAHAGALMKAAEELAATKDIASAKKSLAKVKEAASGKEQAKVELKWEKVASLPALMKQVPRINTKLKANVKPAKFKAKSKDTAGMTAVLAAVAQGAMADTSATKTPEQVEQWYHFCEEMRNAAGAMNKSIHAGDAAATAKNLEKLGQNCEDCHKVFKPDAKIED